MLHRVRPIYESPNGDVWLAAINEDGRLVAIHEPNAASGGERREMDVPTFLDVDHYGPEHRAMLALILADHQTT